MLFEIEKEKTFDFFFSQETGFFKHIFRGNCLKQPNQLYDLINSVWIKSKKHGQKIIPNSLLVS